MPELNPVGDLVLTEPEAMLALADPVRLAPGTDVWLAVDPARVRVLP